MCDSELNRLRIVWYSFLGQFSLSSTSWPVWSSSCDKSGSRLYHYLSDFGKTNSSCKLILYHMGHIIWSIYESYIWLIWYDQYYAIDDMNHTVWEQVIFSKSEHKVLRKYRHKSHKLNLCHLTFLSLEILYFWILDWRVVEVLMNFRPYSSKYFHFRIDIGRIFLVCQK